MYVSGFSCAVDVVIVCMLAVFDVGYRSHLEPRVQYPLAAQLGGGNSDFEPLLSCGGIPLYNGLQEITSRKKSGVESLRVV